MKRLAEQWQTAYESKHRCTERKEKQTLDARDQLKMRMVQLEQKWMNLVVY